MRRGRSQHWRVRTTVASVGQGTPPLRRARRAGSRACRRSLRLSVLRRRAARSSAPCRDVAPARLAACRRSGNCSHAIRLMPQSGSRRTGGRSSPSHDARRELADYLVNRLSGKRSVMYEVATREIPERSLLCLKRNVDEQGAWALGKEFIAILRERPLPKMDGREGAMFTIYWGEVSADSDGPVEWCKPVPERTGEGACIALPGVELADRTRTSRGVRRATERRATGWPGWEPRRAMAARVGGFAVPGRTSMGSTLKISLSSPRISACESPTSRASRSPRRAPPTATSPCRSPEPEGRGNHQAARQRASASRTLTQSCNRGRCCRQSHS